VLAEARPASLGSAGTLLGEKTPSQFDIYADGAVKSNTALYPWRPFPTDQRSGVAAAIAEHVEQLMYLALGLAVIETVLERDRFLANGHGSVRLLAGCGKTMSFPHGII
jgi:hypothetical protein